MMAIPDGAYIVQPEPPSKLITIMLTLCILVLVYRHDYLPLVTNSIPENTVMNQPSYLDFW